MPLVAGDEAATADGARHRLVRDADHGWMLERDGGEGWARQYSFTLDPVWPADLEMANHFTATRPGTRFTTLRIASTTAARRLCLADRPELTISRMGRSRGARDRRCRSYRRVLAETFGLALSADEVERWLFYGRQGEAGRRAGLGMLFLVHVEDDPAGAGGAGHVIGADHRAIRADPGLAARADAGGGAVGAMQPGEIGALAVRARRPGPDFRGCRADGRRRRR